VNRLDKIRIAKLYKGEAAAIRHLASQGMGAVAGYATTEESAGVLRESTPNEKWLCEQLDRIDPHRHEMGRAGDTPALIELVFEMRQEVLEMQQVRP